MEKLLQGLEQSRLEEYFPKIIIPAIFSTIRMLIFSIVIASIIGFILGIILVLTNEKGLSPNKIVNKTLNFIINTIRAFPILILIVAISPLTKKIVGTSVGEKAAIIPLTIVAIPIMTRIIENAMLEVEESTILAAKSFGASNIQIIFKVYLVESLPSIISGTVLTTILFLGTTTIAGAVGAGGLGAVALNYGYQRYDNYIMYSVIIILLIMVFVIQGLGNLIYKKVK